MSVFKISSVSYQTLVVFPQLLKRNYSTGINDKLFTSISKPITNTGNKVSIIGAGNVGVGCAVNILSQGVSNDIVIIDAVKDKATAEQLEVQHAAVFLNSPTIVGTDDYAATAGSKISVITAGVRQNKGESRLQLVSRNVDLFKSIIPQLVKYSPDSILLIISNPVDILTYVAWKLSGFPKSRVIGSGTTLDSSRFRFLIAQKLGISPSSVEGLVIAEHGDSSVPVWSGVNVAGVRLKDLNPNIATDWAEVTKKVKSAAYDVIAKKGYTSWAIGWNASSVVDSILRNKNDIQPVTTSCKGHHGVDKEVFLSLPVILGYAGIVKVVNQKLIPEEETAFKSSADILTKIIQEIKL